MNVVIVGNGMAGARLAELLAAEPGIRVTVFGAEARRPYNRVLLSNVLAGTTRPDQLRLPMPGGVTVHAGVTVASVDRDARVVVTEDGERQPYDVLILATGSEPVLPPIPGIERTLPFRTLGDCEEIAARSATARHAAVIGGGLLGVEAARGLAGRGLPVTLLHLAGHLMERQLDAEAGDVLSSTLGQFGVSVRVGVSTASIEPGGVRLADGSLVAADLVVTSCGVRPVTALARDAGLDVGRGIVVDDRLRTSDHNIYAIGECAEHAGTVYGLVAPCWEQAAVVASLITGETAAYRGSRTVTRLKAQSVELASLGDISADGGADGEIVRFSHPARGTYRKLVIRDDRLVGAILLGETSAVGTLTQYYDRGSPLPKEIESLLFPGLAGPSAADSPTLMPDSATVCQCNNVTKGDIRTAWEAGASTVADVSVATRACTGCGTCREAVEGIVDWLKIT